MPKTSSIKQPNINQNQLSLISFALPPDAEKAKVGILSANIRRQSFFQVFIHKLSTGPFQTTFTGLKILRATTRNEWKNSREILKKVDEAKQRAIGDWLLDGKSHYGGGLYDEAARVLGSDKSQLMKLKSISERFEFSLRRENLSWRHHYEVASINKIARGRGGEILKAMGKHSGGRLNKNRSHDATSLSPKLKDTGINKSQSQRWQKIAEVP